MTKQFITVIITAIALSLSACASLQRSMMKVSPDAAHGRNTSASFYALGSDDIVRVTVQQHPEWSGEFTVRPDGTIFIQNLGDIQLNGLIRDGAEVAIENVLSRYINEPSVTVEIVRFASQVIHVFGEVNNPGRYSTGGKSITVRDAIILAGLPSRFAATQRTYIISPSAGRPRQKVINVYRILYRGELEHNVYLLPGDIVYVPKTIWGEISELSTMVPAARTVATPIP